MSILAGKSAATLQRLAISLVVLTLAWNVVEGLVAIGSGIPTGSVALVGFGLDSFVEVFAGVVILWRFTAGGSDENAERRAVFLIGVSFFLLAAYIILRSGQTLVTRQHPEESVVGIVLALLSLLVMPGLAMGKRAVAHRLSSRSLEAESTETLVCSYLSLTLLGGLVLNSLFGWWWADPIAALGMVYFVVREGWEAVSKRDLCCDEH